MNSLALMLLGLTVVAEGGALRLPEYLQRHKLPAPVLRPTYLAGDFDSAAVDGPMVLRDTGRWYMAYTGWDGDAYRLGLAVSDDLVNWARLGMIFDCAEEGRWDYGSVGGVWLFRHDGWWYTTYCGFPRRGYEVGPGQIGLARAKTIRGPYRRFRDEPILVPSPGNTWDSGGLYRPIVMKRQETWYLFYNAKDLANPWSEQTGVAISTDLVHWRKYEGNPVVRTGPPNTWDSRFASDPALIRIHGRWHLFYYGFDGNRAQDGVAMCVDDNWFQWKKFAGNPILPTGPPGSYDEQHAHKPFVLESQGVYYHYYCCVGRGERAIALATSRPIKVEQRPARPWTLVGGKWKITDEVISQTDTSQGKKFAYRTETHKDFDLSVQARVVEGEAALVHFRLTNPANYYEVALAPTGSTKTFELACYTSQGSQALKSLKLPLQQRRWYTIRVESRGKHLRVYLDGELKIDVESDVHHSGHVSLGTWQASCEFRNLLVNP